MKICKMLRTNLVNDAKINKRNDGRKIYKINMSEDSRRLHSCGDKAPAILVVEKKKVKLKVVQE